MQAAFLDTPRLALTLPAAQKRFGVDEVTCAAILSALADAHVVAKTRAGAYTRYFPHHERHAA
jgi:hypothetical protein